jgi:hypothetical protein
MAQLVECVRALTFVGRLPRHIAFNMPGIPENGVGRK